MKKSYLPPIQNINVLNEKGNIDINYRLVNNAGYCNACTNRDITEICEVTLRSLSFRLCCSCKNILLEKLK